MWVNENHCKPWKGYAMTLINTLRKTVAQRAAYARTRRELAALPADLAIEDLGIYPGDARDIASRAVYG